MKMAVALHSYGCPIPRTEYTLQVGRQQQGGRKGTQLYG